MKLNVSANTDQQFYEIVIYDLDSYLEMKFLSVMTIVALPV